VHFPIISNLARRLVCVAFNQLINNGDNKFIKTNECARTTLIKLFVIYLLNYPLYMVKILLHPIQLKTHKYYFPNQFISI
jgi:hypothetical protein